MTKQKPKNPRDIFAFLFNEERRSSVILLVAAAAALLVANSGWSSQYFNFWDTYVSLGPVTLDLQHWVNEGLMALFFLVVGLEIKRELIDGELRSWRRASFPFFAALGGMFIPALVFSTLNPYAPQSHGWAIPMATDIAIAIGVIGLLGRRIPRVLRVFLLTLAIVDDIGSILVIALFYNQPSNVFALLIALLLVGALFVVRRYRMWPLPFLLVGLGVWYFLLLAGISATLAGVVIAFAMPLVASKPHARLQRTEIVEDVLIPITSYLVVPLFVFANAGLSFVDLQLDSPGALSVFGGIFFGLVIGKPIGILLFSWLSTSLRLAVKPKDIRWSQLFGVGAVAGIGFTISLLIADLAYADVAQYQSISKIAILCASLVAGAIGLLILGLVPAPKRKRPR